MDLLEDFIAIKSLVKNYDETQAIKGLDLQVHKGEIFGFLGPNGAGKTTTIRILTTLAKPTSGTVNIAGFDVVKQAGEVKKIIGVVQQHISLDLDLTIRENMEFHARLHGLSANERNKRIDELLEYVELTKQADSMVERLSGGMKKRASIVIALIHQPKVLVLDEPTGGLDAQSRRSLWELVRRLNANGTTIFLTTHYIEEAEALCDRIGIMHHGNLIALDTPKALCSKLGPFAVESIGNNKETKYRFFADRAAANSYAQTIALETKTVTVRDTNLEDVFVELTGQKVGGTNV